MGSRVLLAEKNDTIRGVAETVLRQNGFDVISVGTADKAHEVLEFSSPDLILIDSSLAGNDNQPTYQKIQSNAKTAALPILLFADQYDESLGLTADKVVIRPFDPADLIQRISSAIGGSAKSGPAGVDPLNGADLSDGFLDQALGLDDIEVLGSEDMDITRIGKKSAKSEITKISGVGNFSKSTADPNHEDSGRVESLMIREDSSDIKAAPTNLVPETEDLSASGTLELSDDQYGLTDPDSFGTGAVDSGDHDYDWFVNSMQSDNAPASEASGNQAPSDGKLSFTGTADLVNPNTPGPSVKPPAQQVVPTQPSAPAQAEGSMDKFIDEFREEVERLGDSELDSIVLSQAEPAQAPQIANHSGGVAVESMPVPESSSWEDSIENVTPEHLRLFTTALANRIADKIAGLILARLDQDKLLRLIKDEIIEQSRKKS